MDLVAFNSEGAPWQGHQYLLYPFSHDIRMRDAAIAVVRVSYFSTIHNVLYSPEAYGPSNADSSYNN